MGISSALGSSALLPAGLGFRNKLINGGFDIWQRGTSSFTTNGAYTADRWVMGFTGTGTAQTVSQVAFTAGNPIPNQEPNYHIRNAVTGGSGSSSLVVLTQKIEDVRTCAGQQVAVSFWAKVTSGTASLGLDLYQDFGSGGSATVGGIGAQKFALTTSWQKFSALITVSSISGKTIGANNFLACRFWFSSGSDYNSLNGTLGIQSNTFDIWGVQLEQNYQPTPFEQRPFGIELALCQRYYFKTGTGNSYSSAGYLNGVTTTIAMCIIDFPNAMRVNPTSLEKSGNWTGNSTGWTLGPSLFSLDNNASSKTTGCIVCQTVGATFTAFYTYHLIAFNDTNAYFAFNAEL